MIVKVVKSTNNELPKYETPESAGQDLRADLTKITSDKFLFNTTTVSDNGVITELNIHPGGRALIPTGLNTLFLKDYEAQIRPRSGLALKYGITVLNSPGTIDADYRLDWGVILMNSGSETFTVKQGDRIAQVVWVKIERAVWEEVDSLEASERDGGFGHSGIK